MDKINTKKGAGNEDGNVEGTFSPAIRRSDIIQFLMAVGVIISGGYYFVSEIQRVVPRMTCRASLGYNEALALREAVKDVVSKKGFELRDLTLQYYIYGRIEDKSDEAITCTVNIDDEGPNILDP